MVAQVLEATPSLDAKGNITWSYCDKVANSCGNANGGYPTVTLPAKSGATPFTISINDKDHLGVTFANNPGDAHAAVDANGAIWMQTTGGCPQSSTFDTGGQIPSVNRVTDTKLTFTDANGQNGPLSITYTLNFVRNGKAVASIDPIISNGGCCQLGGGGEAYSTTYIIGIALVAIILVAIAVRLYQRRNAAPANVREDDLPGE